MNKTKDQVQKEAVQAIIDNNYKAFILMATGVGKSKVAIDYIKYYIKHTKSKEYRFLIVVPTEKLRDENWKEEFKKWGMLDVYEKYVDKVCYASINKLRDRQYKIGIFDEVHNITENNADFFKYNNINSPVALTATYPRDSVKQRLIQKYFGDITYEVTLDEAVEWGLISPYKLNVVLAPLDNYAKVIPAGSKQKPFMITEQAQYDYITSQISKIEEKYKNTSLYQSEWEASDQSRIKMLRLKRMSIFKNSPTKANIASYLLKYVIPQDDRTLIFCGSIEQSQMLCAYNFHSKTNDEHYNQFVSEEVNKLSCVDKLNEGMNIPNIDNAIITQLNSNELDLIQRIGRIVRFREGHVGEIWIVVAVNTVDYEWFRRASINLNPENITFIDFNELKKRYG